jgi:hypothetical protein
MWCVALGRATLCSVLLFPQWSLEVLYLLLRDELLELMGMQHG